MSGDLNKAAQRDAIERHRVAASQGIQVYSMSMVRSHHCETGKATLGRFRLSDDRQMASSSEA
jgi:hypothetical protein